MGLTLSTAWHEKAEHTAYPVSVQDVKRQEKVQSAGAEGTNFCCWKETLWKQIQPKLDLAQSPLTVIHSGAVSFYCITRGGGFGAAFPHLITDSSLSEE